jgi:hypothetical protein bacD2_10692
MLKQGILYNYSKLRFPSMEHLLLLGICAVAVFGWSDSMNSRLILAKQYYTLSALSAAALIFAIKFFRTGILKIDFSTVAWIFTIICTAEAIYAIGQWVGLANSDVIYKVAGHFDNPAGLAACLCVGMPFVIYLYDKGNSKIFLLCGITLLCAVILAKSRTGIIAIVILLTNYTLGKTGMGAAKRSWIIAGTLLISIAGGYFLKSESADGRILIWLSSLSMLRDSIWTGHGPGAFRQLYMDYQADWLDTHPDSAYAMLADNTVYPFNEFLNLALCFGITGLIILCVLSALIFRMGFKNQTPEKITSLYVLATIAFISLFSYPFTYPLTWIAVAVGVTVIVKDNIKMTRLRKQISSIVIFIGAACSLYALVQKIGIQHKWKDAYKYHDITAYQQIEQNLEEDYFFLYNYAVELLDKELIDQSLYVALKCDRLVANYELELLLGDIYAMKGNVEPAEQHYYRAASMCPCRFIPYNQLYDLYIANGYNEKGLSIARKVIDKPIKVRSRPVLQIRFKMKKALGLTEDV